MRKPFWDLCWWYCSQQSCTWVSAAGCLRVSPWFGHWEIENWGGGAQECPRVPFQLQCSPEQSHNVLALSWHWVPVHWLTLLQEPVQLKVLCATEQEKPDLTWAMVWTTGLTVWVLMKGKGSNGEFLTARESLIYSSNLFVSHLIWW